MLSRGSPGHQTPESRLVVEEVGRLWLLMLRERKQKPGHETGSDRLTEGMPLFPSSPEGGSSSESEPLPLSL